jgi:hypothetical protein
MRFAFAVLHLPLGYKGFKPLDILLELAKNKKGSVVHPCGTLDCVFLRPGVCCDDEEPWVSIHIHGGISVEFINPIHQWL